MPGVAGVGGEKVFGDEGSGDGAWCNRCSQVFDNGLLSGKAGSSNSGNSRASLMTPARSATAPLEIIAGHQ